VLSNFDKRRFLAIQKTVGVIPAERALSLKGLRRIFAAGI
jgi:hypothetical protein